MLISLLLVLKLNTWKTWLNFCLVIFISLDAWVLNRENASFHLLSAQLRALYPLRHSQSPCTQCKQTNNPRRLSAADKLPCAVLYENTCRGIYPLKSPEQFHFWKMNNIASVVPFCARMSPALLLSPRRSLFLSHTHTNTHEAHSLLIRLKQSGEF